MISKKTQSNTDVDWASHYDHYEIKYRENYQTLSKPQNISYFKMLMTRGKKYINRDMTFCEIGFSAGITLRLAAKYFKKVVGIDVSPKNVEYTQMEVKNEGINNIELHPQNIMIKNEQFRDSFDVIAFIHGLEHFSETDYPILLSNIKYYLKEGGIFTGALPYKNRFNMRLCPHCNTEFEMDGHISSHDLVSLKKVFMDNGFRVLYLNNFNLAFAMMNPDRGKKLLKYLYFALKGESRTQIEYIVTPINN